MALSSSAWPTALPSASLSGRFTSTPSCSLLGRVEQTVERYPDGLVERRRVECRVLNYNLSMDVVIRRPAPPSRLSVAKCSSPATGKIRFHRLRADAFLRSRASGIHDGPLGCEP